MGATTIVHAIAASNVPNSIVTKQSSQNGQGVCVRELKAGNGAGACNYKLVVSTVLSMASVNHTTKLTIRRRAICRSCWRASGGKAAHDNDHVLLVENVVSDHMHQLINSLDGAALPGCRPGARGCTYWLPATAGQTWEHLARPA